MIKPILTLIFASSFWLLASTVALAQDDIPDPIPFMICEQVPGGDLRGQCETCAGEGQVWTSLGCIDVNSNTTIATNLVQLGVGLSGGFALIVILFGTFFVATSQSNPDKLKQGKDIIISGISGLVFIVLAVVLLNLLGVQILRIPGF